MSVLKWLGLFCLVWQLNAKSAFDISPQTYANLMAKSLANNLPQTFMYEKMEVRVHKVYSENNQVHFDATTPHYKGIMNELKKHKALPENLQKQCRDFSALSMVEQGVEYVLHVEAKNEKPVVVLYDKETCKKGFDPHQKIFIDGYNRYGLDKNGYTRKGVKL